MKPVLYIDIDDTLMSFNNKLVNRLEDRQIYQGARPTGVGSFLRWIAEHFEVRPLTMWATDGVISAEDAFKLSQWIAMEPEWWASLRGLPHSIGVGWGGTGDKISGINWAEHEQGRPWFWIEDDLLPSEREFLKGRHCFSNYIACNVTKNPHRLVWVREELTRRLEQINGNHSG